MQPLLQADLRTPIIIENRAGASGSIGTQAAVTSPPDGTTFLLVFDTHAVNPSVLPNLPFDTLKDLGSDHADRHIAHGDHVASCDGVQELCRRGRCIAEKTARSTTAP